MRLHRLEVQAFGPFADRQTVDFDALTEQGLFLLNGPTGAGKSSVLDAVCYALYGSIPGARQSAKRLRSDHAEQSLPPEVVCAFSVGSRRFEVTRNPAWQRPSKRGSGTTPEQARTLLRERIDGEWVTRSTRNDEAAAELESLLGMNLAQFTRVVMLPQGEFAAFLRSDATARGDLLQRLFATDRFSTVEQLLADHAGSTAKRLQLAEAEREALMTRAVEEVERHRALFDRSKSEISRSEGGAGMNMLGLQEGADEPALEELRDRLASALEDRRRHAVELKERHTAAALTRSRLQEERDSGLAYERLLTEAEVNRRELEAAAQLSDRLDNHSRALVLEAPLHTRDEAEHELSRRQAALESAVALLGKLHAVEDEFPELCSHSDGLLPPPVVFDDAHGAARDRLAEARAALSQELELDALAARAGGVRHRLGQIAEESHGISDELDRCVAGLDRTSAGLDVATAAAAELGQLRARQSELAAGLVLRDRLDAAERSLVDMEETQREQQSLFLTAKEHWLNTLRVRLEQSAAELASTLEPHEACPVCGSEEHPAPATLADQDRVTLEVEQRARDAQDSAEELWQQSRRERDAAALAVASLRGQCGNLDRHDMRTELSGLDVKLRETEQVAGSASSIRQEIQRFEAKSAELVTARDALVREEAEKASLLAELEDQLAVLTLRVEAARSGYGTVRDRVTSLAALVENLRTVCAAYSSRDQAAEVLERAKLGLAARLAESSFADAEEVRAALLAKADVQQFQLAIRSAENTAHRIESELQRPENLAAAARVADGQATPGEADLLAAKEEELSAARALEAVRVEAGLLEQSVIQLDSYVDRALQLEARLNPLRRAHELARSVADTARGNGENLYKMSLSNYVLAARLEQVAAAATERLQHMSDGRYSLVHSDAKAGNKKSGLGLNVIDSWTGMRRDTATLSGGESFMAALALALGLADVVQQESGGLDIETLFVDEGFGSLDEESLEQVMDALENLRDGGRVVGLVSHVPELKQRIPAQLHVRKTRSGSTLHFSDQLQRV